MMQAQNVKSVFDIKKTFYQEDIFFEDLLSILAGFDLEQSCQHSVSAVKLFISESLFRRCVSEDMPLYLEFDIATSYSVKKKIDSSIYHSPQKTPSEIKPYTISMYAKVGVGHFCTLLDEVQDSFLALDEATSPDFISVSRYISHIDCNLSIYPQHLQHQYALNYMPANRDYYVYSIGIELQPPHLPLLDIFEAYR